MVGIRSRSRHLDTGQFALATGSCCVPRCSRRPHKKDGFAIETRTAKNMNRTS